MSGRLAFVMIAVLLGAVSISFVARSATETGFRFPVLHGAAAPDTLDDFRNAWYSQQLDALGEPALEKASDTTVYRFTWLRTFDHPISVRVTKTKSGAELVAKELDGQGGYEPGKLLRTEKRNLSTSQFQSLEDFTAAHGFWELPTLDDSRAGADGAQWIFEAAGQRYHFVDRWSPADGPVRAIGLRMLDLAGWEVHDLEIHQERSGQVSRRHAGGSQRSNG